MREHRRLIHRRNLLAARLRTGTGFFTDDCVARPRHFCQLCDDLRTGDLGIRTVVPTHFERRHGLLCRPVVAGRDRHGILEDHDIDDPTDAACGAIVDMSHLAAHHR